MNKSYSNAISILDKAIVSYETTEISPLQENSKFEFEEQGASIIDTNTTRIQQ